jgi:hypothetical protein
VDAALAEARKAIYVDGNDVEWITPVLFTRTADGRLFDISASGEIFPESLKIPEPVEAAAPDLGERLSRAKPRFIDIEFEGQDLKKPLKVNETYPLVFRVETEPRTGLLEGAEIPEMSISSVAEDLIDLTVQLFSTDFDIRPASQALRLPRVGASRGSARFEVTLRHAGDARITAGITRSGNLLQAMTIKFKDGILSGTEVTGRGIDVAFELTPRDLSLQIAYDGSFFQVSMTGAASAAAILPITLVELNDRISRFRKVISEVISLEVGGKRVYQESIDLSESVNRAATLRLAVEGYRLYQRIFFGPSADEQVKGVGQLLREIARKEALKLQIVSREFILPWEILYIADKAPRDEADVDPQQFFGLRHFIERLPSLAGLTMIGNTIDPGNGLCVGLNVDPDIDKSLLHPLVNNQLGYWQQVEHSGLAHVSVHRTADEVMKALQGENDQILYFYCFADSHSIQDDEGPDASALLLGSKQRLTLRDLNLYAGPEYPLPGNPLVVINTCESASLSPLSHEGFVPYFMAKGARGVIGVDGEVPALFAAEWARRFFDRFLAGEPLGQVMLDLRREFYTQHHNLLGLLYTTYCDGDTHIVQPISKLSYK